MAAEGASRAWGCAPRPDSSAIVLTLMTEAPTLDRGLCICAAAAIFAIVLRWFIWFIAMATDAGGRLTGSRGWGIIMKGNSNPKNVTQKKKSGINKGSRLTPHPFPVLWSQHSLIKKTSYVYTKELHLLADFNRRLQRVVRNLGSDAIGTFFFL